MWPWDHAAVAYLLVSGASRGAWGRPPSRRVGLVALFAGVLPDLIDKPLSWGLGLLPTGRSLAHSLLVAAPAVVSVLLLGAALGRHRGAVAFGIGYLSHLAGDVAYPLFVDGELRLGFLLWPVIPAAADDAGAGVTHVAELVADFLAVLASPGGLLYLAVDAALLGLTALVWHRDRRAERERAVDGGRPTADD